MSKIDDLKVEIERLHSEEFAELFRWLTEKEWKRWDSQIEMDSQAGRLDFLIHEARQEKSKESSRISECISPLPVFWACFARIPEPTKKTK